MSRTLVALLGVALLLGGVRVWYAFHAPTSPLLSYAGEKAEIVGRVSHDVDRRATQTRTVISLASINDVAVDGRVLAVLPVGSEVAYGDKVVLRGTFALPENFETEGGREFNYQRYLEVRGISLILERAEVIERTPSSRGVYQVLFAVKHHFERALTRVMQEPMVSLMFGLLLGEKAGLPDALTQAFIVTGLIHIVVLSGYNIGVVAEWTLYALLRFMSRRAAIIVAMVVIVLFAAMAGGGMATTRAALMGVIALLGRFLQRPAAALRALALAAFCMIMYNPLVVVDAGFILSIAATFGLVTLSPTVETYLTWIPGRLVRATAATTIAVQIFVLPALLYITGVLSFISLPLNILVLPLVPLLMLSGFVAGMLALVHPTLGLLPGLIADQLLGFVIAVVTYAASLPLASTIVPAFPLWVVLAVYVPLTAYALRIGVRSRSN